MQIGIEQAKANIEQMRVNADKLRSDLKYENHKFLVQALVATAALLGAGTAFGNYMASRTQSAPPQVIVLQVPAPATPHP